MERYIDLYNELQDFRRQQPFGFQQFFGSFTARVYGPNGQVNRQAMFLPVHEMVRELLPSLTQTQIQRYTGDLSRVMDLFVRWLRQRRPNWRGQASGKENEPPNRGEAGSTLGGALSRATIRNYSEDELYEAFNRLIVHTYGADTTPWFETNVRSHPTRRRQWETYQRWSDDWDLLLRQPRERIETAVRFLSILQASYGADFRHRHARRRGSESGVLRPLEDSDLNAGNVSQSHGRGMVRQHARLFFQPLEEDSPLRPPMVRHHARLYF